MKVGAADRTPGRQLIIVDHSLSFKGGHYFEYSRSVAQAASRRGWHVCILANQRLRLDDGDSLAAALGADEVRPAFSYGWDVWSDLPPEHPAPGHFGHDVLGEMVVVEIHSFSVCAEQPILDSTDDTAVITMCHPARGPGPAEQPDRGPRLKICSLSCSC